MNLIRSLGCIAFLALLAACGGGDRPGGESGQGSTPDLQAEIEALIEGFDGDVGVYVRHLETGETASIRADELFPTASMIKLPIMLAVFQRVHDGELDYHEQLTYGVEREYPGEDLLAAFQDGKEISLQKLVMLMISYSDNTASLWCQELAGGGEGVNRWLEANGFEATRVNSRTPGREEAYEEYGWGQSTPGEIAEMLVQIRSGAAISPAASEEMYRVLSKSYWDGEALSAIRPDVAVASKQGAVNRSRSEVVLVGAPSGAYVFSVITKNQEDTSWDADNAGFVLLRQVSRLLWQHFEPGNEWKPAENVERYW